MSGKPQAEIDVSADLVRYLIADQHPDLSSLELTPLDSGWDNVMFRLGARMTVRLPRREMAAQLLLNEQRWLPTLARVLPIPVSEPLRLGRATSKYPWPWSILPWFPGTGADQAPPGRGELARFAEFLGRLHQPAPADAPRNPYRGIPLQERAASVQERMQRLKSTTDLISPAVAAIWERALAAEPAAATCWLHGDLHAQNVLVDEGRLSAVIDWGDVTAGDVATDLQAIWGLFEERAARQRCLELYNVPQATLERAMGWAVMMGVVLVDSGLISSPRHAAQGATLLRRLQMDA